MPQPGSLPKYIAVAETLTRDIRAGRIAIGSRLPPERDMAENLGISVGTLRKALAELAANGHLRRVQGSGNYVQKAARDGSAYAFFRLERPGSSGLPTARIVDIQYGRAPDILPVSHAWRIRRIRALDAIDVALEEIYAALPKDGAVTADSMSESLYLTYRTQFDLWITHVEDSVGLAPWPAWGQLGAKDVAGHVTRRAWARDGTLAEASTTWFDTDQARYLSRLA